MLDRSKAAGILAFASLLAPSFVAFSFGAQSMMRVYVAWPLFEYSFVSPYPAFSLFSSWQLVDAALGALSFLSFLAGAVVLILKPAYSRQGAFLLVSGITASVACIAYNYFFPVPASVVVVPVGLLPAAAAAFLSYRSSPAAKMLPVGLLPVVLVAVILLVLPQASPLQTPPKMCTSDFTDLDKIASVVKFRSHEGHDYSDSYEHDLSMKHYYVPKPQFADSSAVSLYSPVEGRVLGVYPEGDGRGYQVLIEVEGHLEYTVVLFHLNPASGVTPGVHVASGQRLGYADTRNSVSFDIAVWRHVGVFRDRLYSYIDTVTDEVFSKYQARGVADRSVFINTPAQASASALTYSWRNPDPRDRVALAP